MSDPVTINNTLKTIAYHLEEISHGLRSGELDPDDAVGLIDTEARHTRLLLGSLEEGS
jgi:hypothetical protein